MIVGVAIRCETIVISLPKPNRHSDCFEYAQSIGIDIMKVPLGRRADDQGFVTHTGKFLNRKQAAKYLKRTKPKQLTVFPIGTVVISEDLW
jgi:hypothetical protein